MQLLYARDLFREGFNHSEKSDSRGEGNRKTEQQAEVWGEEKGDGDDGGFGEDVPGLVKAGGVNFCSIW